MTIFEKIVQLIKGSPLVTGLVVVVLIAMAFGGYGSCAAARYDKQRQKYEADSKAWASERAKLEGQIAERDKQIETLKVKEATLQAIAEKGKKIDEALATKIDQVTKDAAAEATTTDQPADCWIRGDRTCAKLAGLKPPIVIDCDAYKKKICRQ